MPVRLLSSSVLKWPSALMVDGAVRAWASSVVQARTDVRRIGYFGSYARGDWGVGSDLDVIVIVDCTTTPLERRAAEWDTTELPVPTDVLVYTQAEWETLQPRRFYQTLNKEAVWIYDRDQDRR